MHIFCNLQDTTYSAVIKMPSHEFQRICRDLSNFGESITISCTKDGVQFSGSGDIGSAKITLRQNAAVDKENDQVWSSWSTPKSSLSCKFSVNTFPFENMLLCFCKQQEKFELFAYLNAFGFNSLQIG